MSLQRETVCAVKQQPVMSLNCILPCSWRTQSFVHLVDLWTAYVIVRGMR